jgi:hypothetical protein
MDSLPTGSMQSWLIVASASVTPIVLLFLADAIGRLFRHGKGRASERNPQRGAGSRTGLGIDGPRAFLAHRGQPCGWRTALRGQGFNLGASAGRRDWRSS